LHAKNTLTATIDLFQTELKRLSVALGTGGSQHRRYEKDVGAIVAVAFISGLYCLSWRKGASEVKGNLEVREWRL